MEGTQMAIIKQYHKDTDTTYVYESESYWDAEKRQSRSRRKVIGKIDPATGEIVPTGKRGRKKKNTETERNEELAKVTSLYEQAKAEATELKLENSRLAGELALLTKQNEKLLNALEEIRWIAARIVR